MKQECETDDVTAFKERIEIRKPLLLVSCRGCREGQSAAAARYTLAPHVERDGMKER